MGLLSWLYGKGILSSISKDLIKKYLKLKYHYPSEDEKTILMRLWTGWLTLNEKPIRAEDGAAKVFRLNLMIEEIIPSTESDLSAIQSKFRLQSLMSIYDAVLYVETDVGPSDGKIYIDAMKVFVREARRCSLDYSQEFENIVLINRLVVK